MYHLETKIESQGENITLNDTAEARFKKFGIGGNSSQETREGYNLLNVPAEYTILSTEAYKKVPISLKANHTYTIKIGQINTDNTDVTSVLFNFTYNEVEISNSYAYVKLSDLKGTYTPASDVDSVFIYSGDSYAQGAKTNTTYKNLMIYEGTEDKPYEQYGASPSSEFSSKIRNVGDNENLYDKKNPNVLDTAIDNKGLGVNVKDIYKTVWIPCKPNTTYTVSKKYDATKNRFALAYSGIEPNYSQQVEGYVSNMRRNVMTITTNSTAKYLLAYVWIVGGSTTYQEMLDSIKIERGVQATADSGYDCGNIEIVIRDKNLLDAEKIVKDSNNYYFVHFDENKNVVFTTGGIPVIVRPVKIKEKTEYTYILRCKSNVTRLNNINFVAKYTDGSQEVLSANKKTDTNEFVAKFKTNKEKTLDYVTQLYTDSASTTLIADASMILEGDYSNVNIELNNAKKQAIIFPFKKGQRLMEGDYLAEDGIHHKRKQTVLDGTENWVTLTAQKGDNTSYFYYAKTDMKKASSIICNQFKNRAVWSTDAEGIQSIIDNLIRLRINTSRASTVSELKAWLAAQKEKGTPIVIEYELAEEEIEPYTEEQQAVYDKIKKTAHSYDERTHIFSPAEISPIFDVSAYKGISEEFKQRLLDGKITRAYLKVLATDTKPEMIIDENNYLKDCTFEELRYVPDEGFIGGTVAKRVTGNFNNVDSSFSIQDREFELYLGVDLEDGTTEYIKYGTFIVQKPEDDQVNDNTSFEALDYMIKLNLPWVDRMTYPCTLKELFDDLVAQSGLSTKVTSFLNQDFIIENNQFEEGTTRREVLKAIAQMAFNWARIDEDNDIVMDFEKKDEVAETLTADNYYNFKKQDMYGPINVIILRNSQVEGENITIRDEESIEQYGETELVISDNPFAYTQSKRAKLIEAGRILFGLTYIPMSMDMIGYMYLNCKDKIKATNLNNETFETYLLNHTIEYTGTISDSMEAPAATKTETKYQFTPQMIEALKHTELLVDKANQRITEVIEKQTDFSNELTKQETSLSGISQQVSKIYDFKKSVKGIDEIVLEDALPTNILKFEAIAKNVVGMYPKKTLYPSPKLYPKKGGTTLTLVFGRTSRGSIPNPILPKKTLYPSSILYPRADGSYIREYSFYIANPLREYLGKHDIFRVENDTEKGITVVKVIRYVKYENGQYGLYDEPIEEIIDDTQQLQLFKGNNFVYIKEFTDWDISADYIFNNELNKQYAPRVETNANIKTLNNEIELKVSEKVGKDEVITAINLTPEKAKIKSKNLELEGITTINGGFSIDEKGNASIANHTVKINEKGIQLADGASLVGGEGLLSNLQYQGLNYSFGDYTIQGTFGYMGFWIADNGDKIEILKSSTIITADIPSNFKIKKAIITLVHRPINADYQVSASSNSKVNIWGTSRNVALYKGTLNKYVGRDTTYANYTESDLDYYSEISNAFGENGWTPPIATNTSDAQIATIHSIDISDYITSGEVNKFKIQTKMKTPTPGSDYYSSEIKIAPYNGTVIATLNIYGFMSM